MQFALNIKTTRLLDENNVPVADDYLCVLSLAAFVAVKSVMAESRSPGVFTDKRIQIHRKTHYELMQLAHQIVKGTVR